MRHFMRTFCHVDVPAFFGATVFVVKLLVGDADASCGDVAILADHVHVGVEELGRDVPIVSLDRPFFMDER